MQQSEESSGTTDIPKYVARIVAAYASGNPVAMGDLPQLIESTYAALLTSHAEGAAAERPKPAVSVKRSVQPEYLICLEDGKKFKLLKRHLKTTYNMTPHEYRERWGLPKDYPMVAPSYAARRSELAKKIGLGTRAKQRQNRRG